jgi:predicted transposase
MKLTAQLKLLPSPEQTEALRRTLEQVNAACNDLSARAWDTRTFRQFELHRLAHGEVRATFGLSAQVTVRCISTVADAYKLDRKTQRTFRPTGSSAYDDRILRWNLGGSSVSIWTLDGRQSIPFVCGERQRALLTTRHGETDLAYVRGAFYLFATCDVDDPEPIDVDGALGVDLGVTNIAADSDGTIHSGKGINNVRYRQRRLRGKLQRKGTHGARRRLRTLAGQERRYAAWVNHNLSKAIVATAERGFPRSG